MYVDIITLFPEMLDGFLNQSILKRAQEKDLLNVAVHQLRDFVESGSKRKNVDDYAYGGGAGMVIRPEPLVKCIEILQSKRNYDEVIFLTPDGNSFEQSMANELSLKGNLLFICGRYKGIDQRVRDYYVSREISIGDYVISGGELAAAVVVDAVARLIPGVLSDESSALLDSFQGDLLDAPVYTRPADFRGHKVPDILLSGDEARIAEWRYNQAYEKTKTRRPDLLK